VTVATPKVRSDECIGAVLAYVSLSVSQCARVTNMAAAIFLVAVMVAEVRMASRTRLPDVERQSRERDENGVIGMA